MGGGPLSVDGFSGQATKGIVNETHLEASILRILAIIALAAAFMVAVLITYNSGVIGGSGSGSVAGDEKPAGEPAGESSATPSGNEPSEPSASGKTYVVQDGDSFYSIARKFNTSISEIQKLNPNVDPQNLTTGTKLNVP